MTHPPPEPDWHDCQTYEVRLRGHLNARWATRLAVPSLTQEKDGTTTLRGFTGDQAALHGLLQRVRDLGLTLVSVICVGSQNRPERREAMTVCQDRHGAPHSDRTTSQTEEPK